MSRIIPEKKLGAGRMVAVAIENNKTSQYAAKWAVDNLVPKDQCILLLHVRQRASSIPTTTGNLVPVDSCDDVARAYKQQFDNESRELFASFRVFFNRKNVQCKEVLLEDTDIAKALIECVSTHSVELLVLGAPSRSGIVRRFRTTDVPSLVSKGAPPFCTVYIISKGKISSVRAASAPLPAKPAPRNAVQQQSAQSPDRLDATLVRSLTPRSERSAYGTCPQPGDDDIKSPFTRGGRSSYKPYESSIPDSDISFVSSGRPSIDRMSNSTYDDFEPGMAPRLSNSSDFDGRSSESSFSGARHSEVNFSFSSQDSGGSSSRLSLTDDMEAEMRRLKLELKQTMEMYSTACQEALTARQKAMELQRWKFEEQKKLEEARMAEEAALALAERERARCRAALEAAEASKKIAELEAHKRLNAEMKALKESEQKKNTLDTFPQGRARYRRYTIEEIEEATNCFADALKIGEGGYGPVYRCELDLTPVAVKVLRPDAAQGRSQFQQEVEVLSCIRHPNMVLLLGACPEYGCLVYEYMANGSLEDCLFQKRNSPTLPWQLRFRIAAEITTGLLFLHQTKPEPLVHRDLKPANILLDRNFVSKISDVGLARLVPPSVADSVTQYRMTSTAGTFCYIDPEYQQTGMLGIKSDVYSLGIMLLQMITAKPPMGLTHHVGRAIENGTFAEMLDPAVEDWPVQETLQFAKLALQCAEMRRKDRPDLKKVVLPQLNILRDFAEDNMPMMIMFGRSTGFAPHSSNSSTTSTVQDILNDNQSLSGISGYESRSSTSSPFGQQQRSGQPLLATFEVRRDVYEQNLIRHLEVPNFTDVQERKLRILIFMRDSSYLA
ncbi:U-box domain-containing protein 35-like [Neltuma alba]|uniref:U-box domain-containing protein 35-like n=1 Tax=Neltuma alba TaxID=207710 RepID=UPI0010A57B82|nr:U-box domain-containing protein 35-like [Prosopis alba]